MSDVKRHHARLRGMPLKTTRSGAEWTRRPLRAHPRGALPSSRTRRAAVCGCSFTPSFLACARSWRPRPDRRAPHVVTDLRSSCRPGGRRRRGLCRTTPGRATSLDGGDFVSSRSSKATIHSPSPHWSTRIRHHGTRCRSAHGSRAPWAVYGSTANPALFFVPTQHDILSPGLAVFRT